MGAFSTGRTAVRNRAITLLIYRAGLKTCDILALQRRHFEPGRRRLVVPARKRAAEHEVVLDPITQEALDEWARVRKELRVPVGSPLFCVVTKDFLGKAVSPSYLREAFHRIALAVGIDRRVTAEGLRRSGKAHREHSEWRFESDVGRYLDQAAFREAFPEAHEHVEAALEMVGSASSRNSTAVGHECREALASFLSVALHKNRVRVAASAGTVAQLRALVKHAATSEAVRSHADALVRYWGTVSDLAQRQVHGAKREKEKLAAEDSRRLLFHTMIVMYEVSRLVG